MANGMKWNIALYTTRALEEVLEISDELYSRLYLVHFTIT